MTLTKLFNLIEYKSISIYLTFYLVLLGFFYNLDLYYILNDEIIFDFVLFGLVWYINKLINSTNYLSSVVDQTKAVQLSIFIQYYLVSYRYFLLRKKKLISLSLIQVLSHLTKHSDQFFSKYIKIAHANISISIQDKYLYKLRSILMLKRHNIGASMKDSYRSNLLISI